MQLAAKVFENTVEGIMITDADRRIRSVNRAFTEITGYTQHEVLGQKTSILSSGRHDEPFYEQMWQSIGEHGSWQGELWNRRKNGEVYPEWLAINAVRNSLGEITHYVAIFSDLTERKAADERIQFLAHFDVLTSLPNRIHMQDRVELAIHNAVRDNQRLALLLLLDLDRFKTVNESLGHSAGDTLLQVAADRIKSVMAPGEMLARQGGDEFIILLPVISDPGEAALAAERVRDVFANPIELHNHVLTITPSIGISVYPDDGRDYETLVRNADAAMYHAKSSGRNSYKFYTADLNARAREILAIESQLRFALERDEFVLHYQPQVEMESGRIVGAEALIRWNHPSLGLLGPVRFIQVAEERGFIVQIGNWVIAEATRQLVEWRRAGLPELTLAINLSALQFRQPDLALQVKQALESSGLPGHALDIEVTESIIMEDARPRSRP
ncbi:Cyclic di-GMP phosphodiesterase Gmr [Chromobacterium violaceum]|uniref:Cyclic di-GMP phosphodiesterase Gmr n=1 Tax=Chromobacterium violaceum TaxID=536 RepID=A0A3S4HJP9_CHRVL|nr:Cyclic di-GMP phosphodiesterase Gmr [Chromobacterium violaceum]